MASWQDGAEYAPVERPDGFATPRVAVLPQAPPLIDPAANQPIEPPHVFEQRTPAVPLEALVPVVGPTRDPHQAFTSTSAMSSGAWGAVHADGVHAAAAWTPDTPLLTSSSRDMGTAIPLGPPSGRPVGAATQFAPPQGAPVAPGGFPPPGAQSAPFRAPAGPPPGLTTNPGASMSRQLISLLGWPMLALLVVGALIQPLSAPMLFVSWLLAPRAKVVGSQLARITVLVLAAALVLGVVFPSGTGAWDTINQWARVGCVGMLIVDLLVGYRALTSRQR